MLIHKEIEKYLNSLGVEFTSFEYGIQDGSGTHNIIEINLNDGTLVKFEIWPNQHATEVANELRYHFAIYNDVSGEILKTYVNNNANGETVLSKVMKYKDRFKIKGNAGTVTLNESKLKNIIKECIASVLSEEYDYINGLLAHGDCDERRGGDEFYVKCVECYDDSYDDVIWVAAVAPTGMDSEAVRNVKKVYPTFEISSMNDVDGVVYTGDMSRNQEILYNRKAARVDEPFDDMDGLDWNRFLIWPPRKK